MTKVISFGVAMLLATLTINGQTTTAFIGGGLNYAHFQDARFSPVRVTGTGFVPEIGVARISEGSVIDFRASGLLSLLDYPGESDEISAGMGFTVGAGYLANIVPNLYIGASWDLFDFTTMNNNELGNNSNFFLSSSDLFLSGMYRYSLGEKSELRVSGSLAVLSYQKYAPSFTANFPQNIVDEGILGYQDGSTRDPFSLNYMDLASLGNQVYLRTQVEIAFGGRSSLAYAWRMRSLTEFEDHPVTLARHTLLYRYHFIKRTK